MKCPVCEKLTSTLFDPFCSAYCKNKDLLHWLNEDYKIPTHNSDEEKLQLGLNSLEENEE